MLVSRVSELSDARQVRKRRRRPVRRGEPTGSASGEGADGSYYKWLRRNKQRCRESGANWFEVGSVPCELRDSHPGLAAVTDRESELLHLEHIDVPCAVVTWLACLDCVAPPLKSSGRVPRADTVRAGPKDEPPGGKVT